jgi:Domain of unknown function (DUF4942)
MTKTLIVDLKEAAQDFEFYPTTKEIINRVVRDAKGDWRHARNDILDIGAGNGKTLLAFKAAEIAGDLYAIEKSEILRATLPADIFIIGTDFYEQSLLDKQIYVTFCNPPYSQYEIWAKKIIRETGSRLVYLVLPIRWKDSEEIKKAIQYREASFKTLGQFDFENAEDRTARAKVDLIRIEMQDQKEDAFDRFFDLEFADLKKKFAKEKEGDEGEKKEDENKFHKLVVGKNYVASLVAMYDKEMAHIRKNYELVGQLDVDLLREFDVTPGRILGCLKARLKGLKNLYWQELMSRMDEVTRRIISKRREQLLHTINKNAHVDFTEHNAYAVILWILKNATENIDEQLIETYEKAFSAANVKNYKSNLRPFVYDRWRCREEKPTHVYLEYRMVLEGCGRIERDYNGKYKLSEYACETIQDFLTIAYNLGFKCDTSDCRLAKWGHDEFWKPGEVQNFRCVKDGKNDILLEIRAHLNGNMHMRMNQKFALALNVEYGRLKGWLASGKQAEEELSDQDAAKYFKTNQIFLSNNILMLCHKESSAA